MTEQAFMNRTLELAKENVENGGWPFACVIVKNNQIIAEAVNQVEETKDPSNHAEIAAIRKACSALDTTSLSECTMYVVGLPCPMCLSCSIMAKLKNIVYAVDVPQKDAALSNLPLTDSLYNLVSDNYGAKAIEYKHLKSFSDDGIAVFNEWNEHKNNV
tara:strand:- start:292 stop:768 length:477 start_codon:yes stop_codon:yes gene_type:complete